MLRLLAIQPMYGCAYMVVLERNGKALHYEFIYEPPSTSPGLANLDYSCQFDIDLYHYAEPPPPPDQPGGAAIIPPAHDVVDYVYQVAKGKTVELPIVLDERSFPEWQSDVPPDPPDLYDAAAGLAWPVLDQVVDPSVPAQLDSAACGPACAHMVLRDRDIDVPPAELLLRARARLDAALRYRFVHPDTLLRLLQAIDPRGHWVGGKLPRHRLRDRPRDELLEEIGENGSWIAQVGRHFVVVDRCDRQTGQLSIRDPWYRPARERGLDAGTRYRVSLATFFDAWSAVAIYRDEPC